MGADLSARLWERLWRRLACHAASRSFLLDAGGAGGDSVDGATGGPKLMRGGLLAFESAGPKRLWRAFSAAPAGTEFATSSGKVVEQSPRSGSGALLESESESDGLQSLVDESVSESLCKGVSFGSIASKGVYLDARQLCASSSSSMATAWAALLSNFLYRERRTLVANRVPLSTLESVQLEGLTTVSARAVGGVGAIAGRSKADAERLCQKSAGQHRNLEQEALAYL